MRSIRPLSRTVLPQGNMKKPIAKKRRFLNGRSHILIDIGGSLCFSSIFFFIIGLSGGSISITIAGVIVFLVGYFCLSHH